VSPLGERAGNVRDVILDSFRQLVREASDAPRRDKIENFAILLNSVHFLTVLFWLYDRSPNRRATGDLLDFVRDSLAVLRPMVIIPMVSGSLARLAQIMAAVFVGEHA
jgi:hypothetical protein